MQSPSSAYSGYSKVVTTAGELLALAEQRYGECVKPTEISVEFWEGNHPETSFNGSFTHARIRIQKSDENFCRYQLAQEVVQCLSPVPPEELTFFDKGLAQLFAVSIGTNIRPPEDNEVQKKYAQARKLCQVLVEKCGDDIVRRLRDMQLYISKITPADIAAVCPCFSAENAKLLCQPWNG